MKETKYHIFKNLFSLNPVLVRRGVGRCATLLEDWTRLAPMAGNQ